MTFLVLRTPSLIKTVCSRGLRKMPTKLYQPPEYSNGLQIINSSNKYTMQHMLKTRYMSEVSTFLQAFANIASPIRSTPYGTLRVPSNAPLIAQPSYRLHNGFRIMASLDRVQIKLSLFYTPGSPQILYPPACQALEGYLCSACPRIRGYRNCQTRRGNSFYQLSLY